MRLVTHPPSRRLVHAARLPPERTIPAPRTVELIANLETRPPIENEAVTARQPHLVVGAEEPRALLDPDDGRTKHIRSMAAPGSGVSTTCSLRTELLKRGRIRFEVRVPNRPVKIDDDLELGNGLIETPEISEDHRDIEPSPRLRLPGFRCHG